MGIRSSKLARYSTGIVIMMLSACSQAPNYAPVKTVNQALKPHNGNEAKVASDSPEVIPEKPQNSTNSDSSGLQNQSLPQQPIKENISAFNNSQDKKIKNRTGHHRAPQKSAPNATLPEGKTKKNSKPELSDNNLSVKQQTVKKASGDTEKKPSSIPLYSTKNLKNNATISNPTIIASRNESTGELKTKEKVLTNSKKTKEEKSIISIDNKKMLKLNFGWPLKGKMTRTFAQTDHKGIDILGKDGQAVRAAESGKAVYCGQGLKGFGNLVVIKHNESYLSAYANNSKLYIKEGQQVKKGQTIGQLGASGLKKESLHFEIRKNGKPINPLSVLSNH